MEDLKKFISWCDKKRQEYIEQAEACDDMKQSQELAYMAALMMFTKDHVEQYLRDVISCEVNVNKPAFDVFPDAAGAVLTRKCPCCGNDIGTFRDKLSEQEYRISGMCQRCQDDVFG